MALTLHQTIFINKNRTPNSSHLSISQTHFSKLPKFQNKSKTNYPNYLIFTPKSINLLPIAKVNNASVQEPYGTSPDQVNSTGFNFDAFLSIAEFLSLASSVAVSIYAAVSVSCGVQKGGGGLVGSKILVWQCVVLGSTVVVGALIRRRQLRRICGVRVSRSSSPFYGANLLERVEKLEEDLRSSATVIRVMSRQLEKLGIRFRVTRKALKEPIAEAAALAQKNSEATRALAAQEDILEKELGEIQKVLMAMQEQQQKQLELILAIGKAGKLWDTKRAQNKDENSLKTSNSSVDGVPNLEINQIENRKLQTESNNDRP